MSWSDRIIIMGVGTTPEREREIEEAILKKIEEKLA
jgi:hypothetical protein